MFEDFINLVFSGLETDIEKLFAMMLVLFVVEMFKEIFVAVVEVSKR